jgi:acylphosphatase
MAFRARLVAHGRVQGVNYRWLVQDAAKGLGIKGWVKNLPDGSVEILCETETEKAYRDFLKRIEVDDGVRRVEKLEILDFTKNAEPKETHFRIEY